MTPVPSVSQMTLSVNDEQYYTIINKYIVDYCSHEKTLICEEVLTIGFIGTICIN